EVGGGGGGGGGAGRGGFGGAREGRARRGGRVDQGRVGAKSHADRARPFVGSATARRASGAAARSRARQGAGWPAHQTTRSVSLRAMRFSREAILLALPGLPEMGDLHAAPDRDAGWLHVTGEAVAIGNEPRIIVALDFD